MLIKKAFSLLCLLLISLFPPSVFADDAGSARILVFGGTGRLGSDVVKALHTAGHDITVFARETSKRSLLEGLDLDYVVGDVLDLESIESAVSGRQFDVFVDALGRGSASVDFFRDSARNISAVAAKIKIQQLILHGSVGAGESAAAFGGKFGSMADLFTAKSDGELAVIQSGIAYTIIRNSHLISHGTAESGNAALYADQMLTGSVTRQGLARLTLTCILQTQCMNKIYHAVDKSLKHE